MRDILQQLVKNGKLSISSLVNNKILSNWLIETTQQYQVKNLMERAYIVLNGPPPFCEYGNKKQFNTFIKGYRKGCILGNKCPCVTQHRMRNQKETLLKKYGVTSVSTIPGIVEKRKSTTRKNFGVDFAAQAPEYKQKKREFWKNKSKEEKQQIIEKTRKTFLQKYGVEHHMKINEQKQKVKDTNRKKYGVDAPLQAKEIKEKYLNTVANRSQDSKENIRKKTKNTLLLKYGVDAASRVHLSEVAREVLYDKDKLSSFIEGKTRDQVIEELKISPSALYKFTVSYDINDKLVYPARSKFEKSVCDFLDQYNIEYIVNDRKLIEPKEIDIYIPQCKLAIECSGLYWHAEISAERDKTYHNDKMKKCSEQGVQLVTIFEDQWRDKQSIVESRLLHLLNKSKSVIYARNCQIVNLNAQQAKQFLQENHLQGWVPSSYNCALVYKNEIVSLMTFGKTRFSKKNHSIELLRFCNAVNTSVVGAASKLFKHAIKSLKVSHIVSYSDSCWSSQEGLYTKLGFAMKSNEVGYYYTDYKNRFNRVKFQKHKIKHLVECGNEKTEWQIMQELGYDRIWDCGQITWVWQQTINT